MGKRLDILDVATGEITTVVPSTDQVPGSLAWSPVGDLIAYAAVPASEIVEGWEDYMDFDENPGISGRRI